MAASGIETQHEGAVFARWIHIPVELAGVIGTIGFWTIVAKIVPTPVPVIL
jgi:hypothetical protein